MSRPFRTALAVVVLAVSIAPLTGCSKPAPPARRVARWLVAHTAPAFDPDGPPDALRSALERQLSVALVERDSTGEARLGLAETFTISSDSLVWTFRLRDGLRFTDGTPLTSADVQRAILGGLGRRDHATRAWLLSAVAGVGASRVTVQPAVECPDPRTLRLTLAHPDRRLLDKLAAPGVSMPFKQRTGEWASVVGVGPYRILSAHEGRGLTLVAADTVAGFVPSADTLQIRFVLGSARVLTAMRSGAADLVWPLPPGLLSERLPDDWSIVQRDAMPARRLLLVLRPESPPFGKVDARTAIAAALSREELGQALGARGEPVRRWLPGATADYVWPRIEGVFDRAARSIAPSEAPERVERATVAARGESYHFVLAFDADGSGAEVARALQGEWARAGHYAELRPLRGAEVATELLSAGGSQVRLVEAQAPITGAEAELATLVLPIRGPAVGSFRSGWRTRDLDRWVALPEPAPGFDVVGVQSMLADDRVVLPLASIPWQMAVRTGANRPVVQVATGPTWATPH